MIHTSCSITSTVLDGYTVLYEYTVFYSSYWIGLRNAYVNLSFHRLYNRFFFVLYTTSEAHMTSRMFCQAVVWIVLEISSNL